MAAWRVIGRVGLVLMATGMAGPAGAQGFGIAPGAPAQGAPALPGPGFGQAPAPAQGGGGAGGMPSLVGAWSGQAMTANGPLQETDYFSAEGGFVSVGRLQNGFVGRVWGQYRATPVGPNQVRLDTQLQGWLPQQICQQGGGCMPFQVPMAGSSIVSFMSADSLVSVSQKDQTSIAQQRDPNPSLLQVQVQQQFVLPGPTPAPSPSYQPGPAPVVTPYVSPLRPGVRRCDDLQQQRICAINDGHLISSGGCMVCVSP